MPKTKVAITIDTQTLLLLDQWVRDDRIPSRSQAIEAAVAAQLERLKELRFAEACARLDPEEERALAEEGISEDAAAWPEY